MPLKFVFGPSGSGKSTYLYQHVIEESEKYPLKNFIVLVPEQFTMQTQKDLVIFRGSAGTAVLLRPQMMERKERI